MAAERNCFDSASRSKIKILQFREAIPRILSVNHFCTEEHSSDHAG